MRPLSRTRANTPTFYAGMQRLSRGASTPPQRKYEEGLCPSERGSNACITAIGGASSFNRSTNASITTTEDITYFDRDSKTYQVHKVWDASSFQRGTYASITTTEGMHHHSRGRITPPRTTGMHPLSRGEMVPPSKRERGRNAYITITGDTSSFKKDNNAYITTRREAPSFDNKTSKTIRVYALIFERGSYSYITIRGDTLSFEKGNCTITPPRRQQGMRPLSRGETPLP